MDTSSLMEQILSSDNLNRAYLQVVRNKGAEGVDGMILSILVYTFFTRMFDFMLPLVVKYSIVAA